MGQKRPGSPTILCSDGFDEAFVLETSSRIDYHRQNGIHIKFSNILLCNLCNAFHDHYIFYSLKIFLCKAGLY